MKAHAHLSAVGDHAGAEQPRNFFHGRVLARLFIGDPVLQAAVVHVLIQLPQPEEVPALAELHPPVHALGPHHGIIVNEPCRQQRCGLGHWRLVTLLVPYLIVQRAIRNERHRRRRFRRRLGRLNQVRKERNTL